MKKITLNYQDILIIDPCYINNVSLDIGGQAKFDLLKLEKVLHEGDDGQFEVGYKGHKFNLGADSGRIWAMSAETDCEVTIDVADFYLPQAYGIIKYED